MSQHIIEARLMSPNKGIDLTIGALKYLPIGQVNNSEYW